MCYFTGMRNETRIHGKVICSVKIHGTRARVHAMFRKDVFARGRLKQQLVKYKFEKILILTLKLRL